MAITTSYLLVDHGDGLEDEPIDEDRGRVDEKTAVTRLIESFRAEVDKTKAAGEDAVKKTRMAAYTARNKDSVRNLKLSLHPSPMSSSVPPPSEGAMAAMKKKRK